VIRTIVAMAENMKMGVIAEGVESEEHVRHLLAIGCQFGQGYFFSRPINAQATERLLAEDRSSTSAKILQDATEYQPI
jgi:EAL domain-containing protein (putative c-di-GMP-specific phosphodiesterase class I)